MPDVADANEPAPGRQPGVLERIGQSPIAGFAPWIIYGVVASGKSTWLYGALAAAVAAIILAGPSIMRGRHKVLDLVTIAFFVGLTVAGIVTGAHNDDWMDTWSATLSSGILAAVALGSLAFVPFTEQYARESTPREAWDHPAFKRANRVLTSVWGLTFAANAVLAFVSVKFPNTGDWTAWVIPTALLVTAFKITASYPERVRAQQANG
ncbi:DUF3159 domain-containing protein [Mycobacterium triplex]|uniref:Uncharacterized protein n=1 Tax=Mycobacterium triplex TaxID=47839 RepID=A0A024K3Y3_9MYCO|nr:hypothetical protein [Mycobacterium triplex]CDO90750.1 hypothetical protein BN973_05150 [Mycobacterium triplex]